MSKLFIDRLINKGLELTLKPWETYEIYFMIDYIEDTYMQGHDKIYYTIRFKVQIDTPKGTTQFYISPSYHFLYQLIRQIVRVKNGKDWILAIIDEIEGEE